MDILYKVALVVFIAGTFVLSGVLYVMPIVEVPIQNVSTEYVKTTGRVLSVTNVGDITFFTIQDSCILEVLVFEEVMIFEGQEVTVSGKKDSPEGVFIADKLE